MRTRFISRLAITLGAVAVLAVGLGFTPLSSVSTPTAEAATLAQPDASRGGPNGGGQGSGGIRIDPGNGNGRGPGNGVHRSGSPGVPYGGHNLHLTPHWNHVPNYYHFFHGPYFSYHYDWYFSRHISFPGLYQPYHYNPAGVCFAEYYFFEGVYYCFVG